MAGAFAFAVALVVEALLGDVAWLSDNASRLGGMLFVSAGLDQLTPLKRSCLTKCRTPLQFIITSWREGAGGAFQMGLEHGR
ncbi:MAG: DUF2182 domain-containing protein [Dehalococcoidia bacterium]|nr:DUF2182 domain-containing protein [Dehalococcoidia bacterium]